MRTNVLNDLSNVVKKGAGLAGSAAAAVDSCAAGSTTLAEYPGNHPVITQLSPRNHPLLDAICKHVAMIFAVLVMSMANVGMAWGEDVTWNITEANVTTLTATQGASITIGSGSKQYSVHAVRGGGSNKNSDSWVDDVGMKFGDGNLYKSGIAVYVPTTSNNISSISFYMKKSADKARVVKYYAADAIALTSEPSTSTQTLTTSFAPYSPFSSPAKGKYYIVGGYTGGSGDVYLQKVVVTFADAAPSTKRIYMKAGAWNTDSPYFYAHSWGSSNSDVLMTLASCESDVFYADIPSGNTSVLFTRQSTNSGIKYKDQDGNWNQSLDITISTNDLFTFNSWDGGDGKSSFTGGTYSAPTYTISYAANSGSGSMSSQTGIACGTDKATTANAFTRDGYSFTGWKANVDVKVGGSTKTAGTLLADGVTIQDISSNITLTAQWEEEVTYSVTYSLNGGKYNGSSTAPTQAAVASGTEITLPSLTPTKEGYVFASWKCSVGNTYHWESYNYTMTAANTTFTAQWVAAASLVSGTLYYTADIVPLSLNAAISATNQYAKGISSNGVFTSLGNPLRTSNSDGTMEINKKDKQTVDGYNFYDHMWFKGGPEKSGVVPSSRAVKFTIPSAGTLSIYCTRGDRILLSNGTTAKTLTSNTSGNIIRRDTTITAGTYYLYANNSGTSLAGMKFVQSCTAPSALTAATPTAKGITLSVTDANNVNNYEFYVSTSSTAPEAGATATHSVSSAKSLTITNLVAGTTYYAWARSVCGVSNKSGWTALTGNTFTTSTVSADYHLSNVNKTSGATSGIGGSTFTAVFAAVSGYSLPSPVVTIGGNSATSGTDYTWTAGTGTLTINANKINGDIDITMSSPASAPTNVAISGAYHYYPGETISLTATPTGGNGPVTYQWYKGGTADGDAIDGATSATFSKTCVVGDAGSYYCKVTCGGSASTWSDGAGHDPYNVKIMQFVLKNNSSVEISRTALTKVDATHATVILHLTGGTTYKFRITDGCGNYFGNTGTMTNGNSTDWYMNADADCGMTTGLKTSNYTFNVTLGDLGNGMQVTAVYPGGDQAAGKIIYWDNSVLGWDAGDQWYRIGKSTHHNKTQMTLVPGTANLYKVTTAEYNGFEYWHIANNQGDGDGNLFWTKGDAAKAITNAMEFEGAPVTADAITVTPTNSHATGETSDNDNCEFYTHTTVSGMKTDAVTISSYSNGTITVNYVDTDGEDATLTSGSANLAHTVILTSITAVPNTGYDAGAITINAGAYSANYVVTGATTIAATFSPASYTVTLNTNGGTINAGNVTSYTYGTGATLPTNVTKSGCTFGGWYDNSGLTGSAVTTISTTATGNKEYWAKWTAAASLTAISADVLYQAADMANITFTGSDQYWAGLSTNNLFQTYGNGTSNSAKGKTISSTNVTDDISTKSFTSHAYIEGSDVTSGTADPTYGAIEFITPSTAGLLYVYTVDGSSSNLKLRKKGSSTFTALTGSSNYNAIAVDANSNYYIHGNASKRGIYGIQYVSTYAVTITPTNVTKATGATGAGAAIKGKAYTATFTANTGYTLPSDVTVTIGGASCTKGTEYTWSVSDGTGTLTVKAANVTGAIAIGVSGDEAAAPTTYTVTFNSNGGSSVSPIEQASEGASISMPANPTRASYEFDGWYTTAGEKISWPYTPTADITLYARWQEACDAEGVAKSTTDVVATGYTAYQEKGGSNVVFTAAPSLGFKYKDADGNTINSSTTAVVRNNAYSCQIKSDSGNKGSIKTNSTFSNVDSISFYFAASDKGGCKIAVWCSTDNFSTDSTSLLSATTYASNNSEFKLKTLAIPAAKKTSALTFKFRFTVTGAGKTCYMDSLKVYSSTSGGGTCYHVYYHGNGAESGYVNDTVSYTAGSKATVLNYNYGRYPLAKAGNDFQGWATSAGGAVAYTAGQKIDITSADVDLYAVWATASSALVTWEKKVNVATWTDNTTPSTTDPTNIGTIGSSATLIASPSSTSGKTPQIQLASGASNADKGASFTFSMKSADKVVVPTKVSCEVANVGSESDGDITYKAVLTDGAGNTYYSTNSICPNNNGTLNPIDFVFSSGLSLRGNITVKVYAWLSGSGSGFSFRMGPDVKFYGTVDDYACATPSAPTISGSSEYAVGQTITLTASHDGDNYDNLTTYTWYRGADWATASAASPVQDAATGEDGYTLTKTAVAADDDLFWCKVSNGTCEAHNATGYNVNVYAANTITWHLNDGTWGEVEHKDSYTRFDDDYTLPIPSKDGYVFAGWYEASDFSGVTVTVLGSGAIGDKNYYAKWGTAVTVSWTVTKVDGELYRGGGGYSVKAVINETDWNTGFMDELELTATEGVTLKNIEVSENDESKVQVTADFDITTDLAADATEISFTLDVPADGTYGPKVDEHEEALTSCAGSSTTITIFDGATMSDKTDADDISYKSGTEYTDGTTGFKYKCAGFKKDLVDVTEYTNHGSYSNAMKYGGNSTSYYISMTIPTGYTGSMEIVYGSTDKNKYFAFGTSNSSAANGSNGTKWNATTAAATTLYSATIDDLAAGTYYLLATGDKAIVAKIAMTLYATGGGITPTLTWDDGDDDIATSGVSKSTSNDDFVYTASQDKNSLGAITYSSSDATVATVNATTGQVHLVGAAGSATITATIAASGCYESASVSYTITVTDDCDDEAGTIETEDLGCSGVKMTVTGHTAAAGVSYQWYKEGTPSDATVGTNQDNFTATEAGSYYVIVTNTGDRHCAKRSTNTITVEAQAAATATKIVDSWYVKNGRRTPDIELVKTTNATSFTVTSGLITIWESAGSTKTGFGGCGFHMDENGIIYLNGTKDDDGSATTGLTAGDETLTITAIGCGGNASQNITIHKQTATDYKEIAFVVDGEKGKDFDQVTSGHAAGTELYTYLDSVGTAAGKRLFKLTQQNIYSTTDEKAIRQHYSQFDGILITDDPSTNTTPEGDYKTKGYVNAFGTMVDVRPIFTMEAYVSALKNWGSKGIAGNPQSPNPRQYEMRLECKDHEIYKSGLPDPEDGTNVWEETIGGETFRHVIIVDSTKGVYNGVAYNAETAGNQKPALQGFTGEAAGSLLGLGRILKGTLQAAIERQEEPAARLLVMGINAKALQPTCALTNEGKAVIKNILTYLLKTNMEEVDDCSNYFTGKNSTSWSDPGNWSKSALPSSEAKVRILAPCVISGIQPHVLQVSIVNSGNSNIRYTATSNAVCNGTLTINADGALIADGKIRSAVAPHFAANDLMPTTPEMLTINTNGSGQAALIFNNEEGLTKAKVNLHSLGRNDGSYKYQYFAIPMEYVSVSPAFANETHGGTKIYTYVYNEASSGWTRRGYYDDLYAFEGLGITTKSTVAMNYTMTGTLASTATKEITLTHDGAGLNLIGNSWMAPIQIGALAEDNTDANITKTVYIYCAGRDIVEGAATSGVTETAGQWLAVPFEAADFATWKGLGKLSVIPAMQAFQIKTAAKATLTLDYDKVVRGSTNDLNAKLRAPRRRVAAKEVTMTNIRVSDSKTHTDLSLFEGERFSDEFDNGWEAEYMNGDGRSAKLYAETVDGKMAVVAMTDYEGTMVGFAPGQESVYIFSFMGADNGYYLNDIKMQQSVRISEGETYSFTYEDGDDASRFMISRTPFEKPGVATGTENIDASVPQARKILYNDKLYIIRGGHMYDATGKMVK